MFFFKKRRLRKGQEEFDHAMNFYESQRYQKAIERFQRSSKHFIKGGRKKKSQMAQAFKFCSFGYINVLEMNFHEAIRWFGKANVLFSTEGFSKEAKQTRAVQARTQEELAREWAKEGKFIDSARLYESAAALYQTTTLEKEAARARARSFVQRAAAVESAFDKAYFLEKAVEEFQKGREDPIQYEAHALYQRAKGLIEARESVKEAIDLLTKAHTKFRQIGNISQTEKVKRLLLDLTKEVKTRPSEFGI